MGDSPARSFCDEPETSLPIEPINLIDDPIYVIWQVCPCMLNLTIMTEQFGHSFTPH